MSMKLIKKLLIALSLASGPVFCELFGVMPLSTVLNQADEVVVTTIAGSSASGSATVDLTVQRVLKGSLSVQSTITAGVAMPDATSKLDLSPQATAVLPAGKAGVWFLRQAGSTWQILPLVGGDISPSDLYIAVPNSDLPSAYTYDAAADPKKKLVSEIEAATNNPATAAEVSKLEMFKMIDSGLGADLLQSMYADLASSSQSIPKAVGLAGQVRAGHATAVKAVAALPLSTLPYNLQGLLTRAVCDYRGTDATGITGLATLSESGSSPQIKMCAAHALREIHTKETLPALEQLLNSPIPAIRYDPVIGIAQFAMSFPIAKSGQKFAAMENWTPPRT